MNLTITPSRLAGSVTPPPSKSQAHRLLIAAALAGEGSVIHGLADSQDIQATRRCMAELKTNRHILPHLDCGESGSTLRFLIPVALALRGGGVFTGRGRLMERPQTPYFGLFDEKGIRYAQKDGVLTVEGRLPPGTYRLPGNVSSQFITGLLFALPLLEESSVVIPTTRLESEGYVRMTLDVLREFGITVHMILAAPPPAGVPDAREVPPRYILPGSQRYAPQEVTVEADWSQAAFWYAANCLGSRIEILGLNAQSTQGDMVVRDWAAALSSPGDVTIDVAGCPDLVPPLAAMAAVRRGTVRLVNAARLRLKECDRLAAITAALTTLGADVTEHSDSLTIRGGRGLSGGTVDCRNDHRIAMMAAVAATACREPVTLIGAGCVAKSYPSFWAHYRMLGGVFHEHPGT